MNFEDVIYIINLIFSGVGLGLLNIISRVKILSIFRSLLLK